MTPQEELRQITDELDATEMAQALAYLYWLRAQRERAVHGYSFWPVGQPEPRDESKDYASTARRRDLRARC
jgi:hypothetical protein